MFEAKEFDSIRELKGISQKTMSEHYKLYQGYVKKSNEILEKLKMADKGSANQVYSDLRSLKVDLSFALGGMKNHEIYFEHLGGDGSEPKGEIAAMIERDFGSYTAWKEDLKATGMAGRGWAWLCYDWDMDKLINYLGDSQNTFPIWSAEPLVALDVYEHAYFLDYGVNRAEYIEAFFQNLNWQIIEENFNSFSISKKNKK